MHAWMAYLPFTRANTASEIARANVLFASYSIVASPPAAAAADDDDDGEVAHFS
jgi:hypothetical protein